MHLVINEIYEGLGGGGSGGFGFGIKWRFGHGISPTYSRYGKDEPTEWLGSLILGSHASNSFAFVKARDICLAAL